MLRFAVFAETPVWLKLPSRQTKFSHILGSRQTWLSTQSVGQKGEHMYPVNLCMKHSHIHSPITFVPGIQRYGDEGSHIITATVEVNS